MTNHMQPKNPDWGIPLPGPKDAEIRHAPRIDAVHEINPSYLSYWEVDGTDRAGYFLLSAFGGLIPSSMVASVILSNIVQD